MASSGQKPLRSTKNLFKMTQSYILVFKFKKKTTQTNKGTTMYNPISNLSPPIWERRTRGLPRYQIAGPIGSMIQGQLEVETLDDVYKTSMTPISIGVNEAKWWNEFQLDLRRFLFVLLSSFLVRVWGFEEWVGKNTPNVENGALLHMLVTRWHVLLIIPQEWKFKSLKKFKRHLLQKVNQ